jgi:hypothetical protein
VCRTSTTHRPAGVRRNEAVLSVVAARVLNGDGETGEHQRGISEVQPSMFQGGSSLFRVEVDIYRIIVSRLLDESICVIQKSEGWRCRVLRRSSMAVSVHPRSFSERRRPARVWHAGIYRPSWMQTARATAAMSSRDSAPSGRSRRRLLAVAIWSAIALWRSPFRLTVASAG